MKLEPKHVIPYLDYRLNIQVAGENIDDDPEGLPRIFNMVGIVDDEIITHKSGYISNIENEIEDCFPILRPLSDLKLDDHSEFNEKYYISFGGYEGLMLKGVNETYTRLLEIDYLFENHFDVFGLIDAGLAIDINTLNK